MFIKEDQKESVTSYLKEGIKGGVYPEPEAGSKLS
jgi:hypothetical protein